MTELCLQQIWDTSLVQIRFLTAILNGISWKFFFQVDLYARNDWLKNVVASQQDWTCRELILY